MRWYVFGLFAILGTFVLWLAVGTDDTGKSEDRGERNVWSASWRALPESEMTIPEMERYVEGIVGNERLWEELQKNYADWLVVNQERLDGPYGLQAEILDQPRLAMMIAREFGKRDGEAGMMTVATWHTEPRDPFVECRVNAASFAGWVTVNPEEAIRRLIETKEFNIRWYVENEERRRFGVRLTPALMDEVLREGFQSLMHQDPEVAKELLVLGRRVRAFNPSLVGGAVIEQFSAAEKMEFFSGPQNKRRIPLPSFVKGDRVSPFLWDDDWATILSEQAESWMGSDFEEIARIRPDLVPEILKGDYFEERQKIDLLIWMGLQGSEYYGLLKLIRDELKYEVIRKWLFLNDRVFNLGPVTGKENMSTLDLKRLVEVMDEIDISHETRSGIEWMMNEE